MPLPTCLFVATFNRETDMVERDAEPVEVYRARNLPEAHVLRLMLEGEGITVAIANETLQGIVGEVAMGWTTSPRLMVRRQDAEQARTLLASQADHKLQTRNASDPDVVTCLACGIPMGDDLSCSACGWSYGDDDADGTGHSITAPESAAAGTPVEAPPEYESILPVLSDTPVLPVRMVWFEVAAVMCIGFVPNLANSVVYADYPAVSYQAATLHMMAWTFSSTLATFYIIARSGESWREFGYGTPRFTDLILAFVLTMVIWYFGALLQLILEDIRAARMTPAEDGMHLPATTLDYCLMPIMYLIAATSEEVIMRSYLMTRLRQLTHRPWLGVIVSAFLFSLYHSYQGFSGAANAFFVGLVFGSIFAAYPRIWPLVLAHTMTNIMLELQAIGHEVASN